MVEGDKGGSGVDGGGKLRQKKTEKSKVQVPRAPPLRTLPIPFKRLHKQSSECCVSERIT